MKKIFFFAIALILAGAGCAAINSSSMVKPPLPDDIGTAYRNLPKSGSLLLDDTTMSPTFKVRYDYSGGSYPDSKTYTISLQAKQEGQISSGEKTATFPVDNAKLEELFRLIVSAKVFNAEPMALVRVRDVMSSLFGVGGSTASVEAQADRIVAPLPSIPFKIRDSNIDIGRVMRMKGLPQNITPELLQQAVEEAKGLIKVFEAIEALVPDEARERVK